MERLLTAVVVLPFGTLCVCMLTHQSLIAVVNRDIFPMLILLATAAWFGFITWSVLAYTVTGYHPVAFVRLYNAIWGWLVTPMPMPPARSKRHEPE